MEHFPQVPDYLVKEALLIAHDNDRKHKLIGDTHNFKVLPEYNFRITKPNGEVDVSRRIPRYPFNEEFNQWTRTNICDNFMDTGISVSEGTGDTSGMHVDGTREYLYLYLIEQSNPDQTTCWWQENGHPIERINDKSMHLYDWNNVIKLDETQIPLNRWVAIHASILHSIHNIQGSRISLQVSLYDDPFL